MSSICREYRKYDTFCNTRFLVSGICREYRKYDIFCNTRFLLSDMICQEQYLKLTTELN